MKWWHLSQPNWADEVHYLADNDGFTRGTCLERQGEEWCLHHDHQRIVINAAIAAYYLEDPAILLMELNL